MNDYKKEDYDELYDENWVPSPEDFIIEKPDPDTLREKQKREKTVKWVAVVVALMLVFQIVAVFFSTFSIDAIRFLKTSYHLSQLEEIQEYKRAVVTIQGDRSRGTGFSVSSDGLIITNHHVIENQGKIVVGFNNDQLYEGTIISSYPNIDLAFLKVEAKDVPFLPLSHSNGEINDRIFVIGNPLSWTQIANEGHIVETKERTLISAPIYRGNSGSPVINEKGEVVAVVYAKRHTKDFGGRSVGVAIPIEYVSPHLPRN